MGEHAVLPSPTELSSYGFADPRRASVFLAELAQSVPEPDAFAVLESCRSAPDPDEALAAFARCGRAMAVLAPAHRSRWLGELSRLLLASDLPPRLLSGRPGLLRLVAQSAHLDRPKPLERMRREALAAVRTAADRDALYRRLRRYKYRELFRIMARDLRGAPIEEIGRETAHLAQSLIAAALEGCFAELCRKHGRPSGDGMGFCVLGLGKLGGEDLNFSSDVDLIYLYREDGQTDGGHEHVRFYTRLSESLTQALSTVTGDGFVFRVDLNLRPQGRAGAIVLSLSQLTAYYETFGRTWERAAMLKARVVAGDEALADEALDAISPFVWRKSLDFSAVDALRELKNQIDLRSKASERDLKLGPGGIREIEFFVNALQLLHGGKRDSLRERHTLRGLRKLEQAGLLSATDADRLEEAYLFLRRAENRLQMLEERQTQSLPDGERERIRLARSLGYSDWPSFARELERHRKFVREAFSTLLGQTARDEVPDEPLLALALDLDAPEPERAAALARRGFEDPDRAMSAIARLTRASRGAFAPGPSGPGLQAVRLLAEVLRTPDPDQALQHFAEFIDTLASPQSYLDLLSQSAHAGRRLLNLFGQSEYLSRYFVRHPELLDALLSPTPDEVHKGSERIRQELAARVHRHDDPEERLSAMRRYKNEEVLRIGLYDIGGQLDVPDVARQLTAIADGCLDECLFLAEAESRERYGEQRTERGSMLVIGMGKLGGEELGYHSDLDLIFVYPGSGEGETSGGSRGRLSLHEYFAKVAQRLLFFFTLQLREGTLYKVDTRLRPSGNKGTLVVSEEAFFQHHDKRAQLWERQALTKARAAAGNVEMFERIRAQLIGPLVYERPLPPDAHAEIDRLRMRMEKELAQESLEAVNPKLGHGGLVDVEFATQYLQLRHGALHPSVRTTNTLAALDALEREGCLDEADARSLREGYLFLRRVENRLRLVHGHSLSSMPTSGRPLELLARRLGYLGADAGKALLCDYRARTEAVRATYCRLMSG